MFHKIVSRETIFPKNPWGEVCVSAGASGRGEGFSCPTKPFRPVSPSYTTLILHRPPNQTAAPQQRWEPNAK